MDNQTEQSERTASEEITLLRDLCARQQATIESLSAAIASLKDSAPSLPKMKFAEVVRMFLDSRRGMNPTTLAQYDYLLVRSKFAQKIAGMDCDELTFAFIQRLIDGEEYVRTVKNFATILKTAIRYARERDLCATPPEYTRAFSYRRTARAAMHRELDAATVERLRGYCAEHIGDDSGALAVLLGLECGLRIGEVCGLKWSDYSKDGKVLHIQRARKQAWTREGRHQSYIGPTKTRTSNRIIPLPSLVDSVFAAHADEPGFCFHPRADRTRPQGIREFRDHVERFVFNHGGFAHFTFHSLRHTFVSRQIRAGKNVKAVSAYVGHADIKMTIGTYTHLNQNDLKEVIA